jgi:hypothetical protein
MTPHLHLPTVDTRLLARSIAWGSLALNAGVVVVDLATGQFTVAALQTVVLVGLMTWLRIAPSIEGRYDALCGRAIVEREMAEMARDTMSRAHEAAKRVGIRIAASNAAWRN